MLRISWLITLVLILLYVAWPGRVFGAKLDAATIKAGLRTTATEEQGFVDRVMTMVDQGKLPRSMVDSTFDWARKKPQHKFQFFKRALVVRAARQNIEVK
jgi:hypothetical protein